MKYFYFQEEELKDFIKSHSLIHPYNTDERPCFLYFLIKDKVLVYVGLTVNYHLRYIDHMQQDYKSLFEDEKKIEMIVAPIGKRNIMFIMDLEATFIRLFSKKINAMQTKQKICF